MPNWKWKRRPEFRRDDPGSTLQVARLEAGALGLAQTQTVAKIGFEIAIVGVDSLERSIQKRGPYRPEHVLDVLGEFAAVVRIAAVVLVGQEIVFRDHVTG